MTDNKPKRTFRQKLTIAIVAVVALSAGVVAGNWGWTLIEHFIQSAEREKRPGVGEVAAQAEPFGFELTNAPQAYTGNERDTNRGKDSPGDLQRRVDPEIQSGLKELQNRFQRLYEELGCLSRKLDSYRKAAGIGGGPVTYVQSDLRKIQSDLKKLQDSVKANYQSIQRITDSRYGREFVTLSQVQSLVESISKVNEHKIRDVVEKTLRDYRLTGQGRYGTINRTINDMRRDIDRIDQSMGNMRRDIDELKRKIN